MRRVCLTSLVAVLLLAVTACSSSEHHVSPASGSTVPANGKRPNIVFVLADDLDLASYLDAARFPAFHDLMTTKGATFDDYFVTDSLCCPSRASMLRGQYVHNHDVEGNLPPAGGFEHWQQLGLDSSTIATWMHDAGYRTGLLGKYLNGYPATVSKKYVPPGWDEWVSPSGGNPYAEYNYQLNDNGKLVNHGAAPDDYLVDVLAKDATAFITQQAGPQPFFMYVAPYVPHQPATPAPRYANAFAGVKAPRGGAFDAAPSANDPAWLQRRPLTPAVTTYIDQLYRRRLQSMLAVEDLLRGIVDTLQSTHQLDNTYIFFTSDNGFHLGEHRLPPGKQTAFDTDIHVPLVVRGPGITGGRTVHGFAREIDLAPTFAALGGAHTADFVDGVSLAEALHGGEAPSRDALVEHFGVGGTRAGRKQNKTVATPSTSVPAGATSAPDPDDDANPPAAGAPDPLKVPAAIGVGIPTYDALRTGQYLYVEYVTGEKQLFDVRADPDELHNVVDAVDPNVVRDLAARLARLVDCTGATCRT